MIFRFVHTYYLKRGLSLVSKGYFFQCIINEEAICPEGNSNVHIEMTIGSFSDLRNPGPQP